MASLVTQDDIVNPSFDYIPISDPQYAKLYKVMGDGIIPNVDKFDHVRKILAQEDFPPLAFKEGTQIKVMTVSLYGGQRFTFLGYAMQRVSGTPGLRIAAFILEKYPLLAQDVPSFNVFIRKTDGKITDEKRKLIYEIFRTFLLSGMRLNLYWEPDSKLNYTNSRFKCTVLFEIASSSIRTSTFLPIIEECALSFRKFSISQTVPEIASIPDPLQSIIADYLCVGSLHVDINRYSNKTELCTTALGIAVEKGNIDIIPSLMYLGADPNLPHNKGKGATERSIFEVASPEVRAAMLDAVLSEDRERILATASPEARAAIVAHNVPLGS